MEGALAREAAPDNPARDAADDRSAGPGQRRRQKNQRQRPGPGEQAPAGQRAAASRPDRDEGRPAGGHGDGLAAGDRPARKPRHRREGGRAPLALVPDLDSPAAAGDSVWTAATETPATDATFASLGVPPFLVRALDAGGISTPFPIQAATLPDSLAGRDILGRAQTGSGKTLGFSLPLVARLASGATMAGRPRGLVLVPTRELASQVQEVLEPLARSMGLSVATIFGGVSYRPQINALHRRTDIVVACPGRLADLIGQGACHLGDVEITVLDEADHMADLGFLPTVRRLLDDTPADGQRLLFSATLDGAVDVLAKSYMNRPVLHSVDDNSTPAAIDHRVFTVSFEHRQSVLEDLVSGDNRSLVFTRTKHGAEKLAKKLTEAGIPATDLHGNLSQAARARNLGRFSAGHVRVLVATDVAARGIHVDGVDLVIHADPPTEHKAYTHRSGRTARGGASGTVITVQTKSQSRDVSRMMRAAGVKPASVEQAEPGSQAVRAIAGPVAEPPAVPEASPADRQRRRSGGGGGGARRPRRPDGARHGGGDSWHGSPRGRSGQFGSEGGRPSGKRREQGRSSGTAKES
ncbi:MAG TPA: DEAD/DEAH box helicase [Trebonia sp.]|nr:DEAD/DEAH box helicase [Trebonia sp.]